MAYFIRVLSSNPEPVLPAVLSAQLAAEKSPASVSDEGQGEGWQQMLVSHADGTAICLVERNSVEANGVGFDEIQEFLQEVGDCLPKTAAAWLIAYLPKVRSIYALQVLEGAYGGDGWNVIGSIKTVIWRTAGGIIQADGEGFTNEEGFHILWQFSDSTSGSWCMSVLKDGLWYNFRMDLGDARQRSDFLRGETPVGVELLD